MQKQPPIEQLLSVRHAVMEAARKGSLSYETSTLNARRISHIVKGLQLSAAQTAQLDPSLLCLAAYIQGNDQAWTEYDLYSLIDEIVHVVDTGFKKTTG